nr:MAG TPA: hypothetical protein [Caudoviricetes sp.]
MRKQNILMVHSNNKKISGYIKMESTVLLSYKI